MSDSTPAASTSQPSPALAPSHHDTPTHPNPSSLAQGGSLGSGNANRSLAPVRIYPSAHRVSATRYATSTDRRGYIPVYEYPLNGQYIMMDCETGLVHFTGIWKALGHTKADVVKLVESDPNIGPHVKKVRGGYLKIQGTWLPYDTALTLARRVAWQIRYDLIPLFGPEFPDTCLGPSEPGFGQLLLSAPKLRSRRSNRKAASVPIASPQMAHPPAGPSPLLAPADGGPVRTFRSSPAAAYGMGVAGYGDPRAGRYSPYEKRASPDLSLEPLQPLIAPGIHRQISQELNPGTSHGASYPASASASPVSYDAPHDLPVGNALPSMRHAPNSNSGLTQPYFEPYRGLESFNILGSRWFGHSTMPSHNQFAGLGINMAPHGDSHGLRHGAVHPSSDFGEYGSPSAYGHGGLDAYQALPYADQYPKSRRPSSAPEFTQGVFDAPSFEEQQRLASANLASASGWPSGIVQPARSGPGAHSPTGSSPHSNSAPHTPALGHPIAVGAGPSHSPFDRYRVVAPPVELPGNMVGHDGQGPSASAGGVDVSAGGHGAGVVGDWGGPSNAVGQRAALSAANHVVEAA